MTCGRCKCENYLLHNARLYTVYGARPLIAGLPSRYEVEQVQVSEKPTGDEIEDGRTFNLKNKFI